MNNPMRVILSVALIASLAACSKKVKEEAPTPTPEPTKVETPVAVDDGKYDASDLDSDACLRQRVVYFDFDKAEIRGEAQAILACHGKYLVDRPSAAMTLEGHADERGSREYNLGLGERRGNAVSSALQANGGSASQLNVVSYGEERPNCSDSSEECWGKNRRVEIVYTAK
ncbi:MAG TPA: peptidoglycan-associated lipoprotein Pal [Patescibacteria group bacterium]|nr:peptidoglycan-associated lipoprotein Pal [Patescibacteria group bacterium]